MQTGWDQARGDLQHARSDVEGAFYDWACFSAQQAAEKAVKAFFQRMGAVVWGYSVADVLDELAQRQVVPEDIRDAALELDKAYILSRYPDTHPSGSLRRRYIRAEAERLVEYAAKIVRFCEGLLSTLVP